MKLLKRIGAWFSAHRPTKRRIIQLYAALLTNANLKGFGSGKIYQGDLKKLCAMGCRTAVLTGVVFGDRQGAMAYDSKTDTYSSYFGENLPVSFHGTGDIFSSALCGALVRGQEMEQALKTAVDFTVDSIRISAADPDLPRYGVRFEAALPGLIQSL